MAVQCRIYARVAIQLALEISSHDISLKVNIACRLGSGGRVLSCVPFRDTHIGGSNQPEQALKLDVNLEMRSEILRRKN